MFLTVYMYTLLSSFFLSPNLLCSEKKENSKLPARINDKKVATEL